MKKIKPEDHATWLAVKKRRREIVLNRCERRKSIHQNLIVTAPKILSLSKNAADTIKFFEDLKDAIYTKKMIRKRGKWRSASVYIDLSKITRLSIPAAVILSAELDRWRIRKNMKLSARKLSSWAPRVKSLLADLGCFELVGAQKIPAADSSIHEEITVLKLRSRDKSDGAKIQKLQSDLSKVFQSFKAQPYIYEGLVEAASNCINHAYPSNENIKPKYPYAGHRWWATACVDPRSKSLRFFIYDQGVGIPKTIGEKEDWRMAVNKFLPGSPFSNDASVIEGAFEIGLTSTGIDGRGRGLNQMRSVIETAENGYIRVISGKGDVKYNCGQSSEKQLHPAHIGGTLVEWSIPIDAVP